MPQFTQASVNHCGILDLHFHLFIRQKQNIPFSSIPQKEKIFTRFTLQTPFGSQEAMRSLVTHTHLFAWRWISVTATVFPPASSLFLLGLCNPVQLGSPAPPTNTQKAEPCLNPAALINLTDFVNYLFGWLTACVNTSLFAVSGTHDLGSDRPGRTEGRIPSLFSPCTLHCYNITYSAWYLTVCSPEKSFTLGTEFFVFLLIWHFILCKKKSTKTKVSESSFHHLQISKTFSLKLYGTVSLQIVGLFWKLQRNKWGWLLQAPQPSQKLSLFDSTLAVDCQEATCPTEEYFDVIYRHVWGCLAGDRGSKLIGVAGIYRRTCVWLTWKLSERRPPAAVLWRKSGNVLHVEGIIHDYSSINRKRGWRQIRGLTLLSFPPSLPSLPLPSSSHFVSQLCYSNLIPDSTVLTVPLCEYRLTTNLARPAIHSFPPFLGFWLHDMMQENWMRSHSQNNTMWGVSCIKVLLLCFIVMFRVKSL